MLQHFLLTRFNCRINIGWPDGTRGLHDAPSDNWVEHRIRQFEAFCFPAIVGQTSQEFTWLVFFDLQSSTELRQEIFKWSLFDCFNACFVEQFDADVAAREVVRRTKPDIDWILTTRLDNDDAISCDFVNRVRTAAAGCDKRRIISFPEGATFFDGRLFAKREVPNPFISLLERKGDLVTVFAFNHLHAGAVEDVQKIEQHGERFWIQNCHDRTQFNRAPLLRRRVKFSTVRRRFSVDALQVSESRFRLARDRCEYWARRIKRRIPGVSALQLGVRARRRGPN